MKRPYIIYFLLVILSIICTWSCTNDEGSDDIDTLTPTDSVQGISEDYSIPN
ncbi:hypothetical protein [uncultured Muriicola sp.]|uniref:hypothetical protein n=1 Tax=uncultured Muriicola sp. TaxID=1583102 RepID=UPI00262689BB|nr:hypothetical protein [uncultured Muriicola sp.]